MLQITYHESSFFESGKIFEDLEREISYFSKKI